MLDYNFTLLKCYLSNTKIRRTRRCAIRK